ncbi:hypothetical protein RhiirA5_437605 [Rhizophagus irregularis]|uniref:Uncharacterized protein n=1 Tax=Rhizophagus irregularis TaxID=588596 RepID=A0A2N0NK95_9GLOM|nr:hypothetical protein RhiirA5_437605 [Rhizophagus irregularis]
MRVWDDKLTKEGMESLDYSEDKVIAINRHHTQDDDEDESEEDDYNETILQPKIIADLTLSFLKISLN